MTRPFATLGPFALPGFKPQMLRVHVPGRCPDHDRPLLMLFDGQNVFDDRDSFAGGWHAHVAVRRLARSVEAPLVVAIDHGNEERIAELSPYNFRKIQGRLPYLLDWIDGFLMPYLIAEHGVSRRASRRVLGGSSMGGLASFYGALTRPHLFGGALAMSPSLFVAERGIFSTAAQVPLTMARWYLDAGAREGFGTVENVKQMANLLGARGAFDLLCRLDARGGHNESSWRRRLLPALRFHFGTSRRKRP